MTVAPFAISCGTVASTCAFPPSVVPLGGATNVVALSSRGPRTTGYAIKWSVASPSSGNFRRLLIRWEHCSDVYRAFFLVALGCICIKRLLRQR